MNGPTALALPSKQWRGTADDVAFIANELCNYEIEQGPFLLPTQHLRLKELMIKLPPVVKPSTPTTPNISISQSPFTSADVVKVKLRRCCDSLLPLPSRIVEMNQMGRDYHHSRRKNLTVTVKESSAMKTRLKIIEIARRFVHPAASMGDSSTTTALFPDEWELDLVEGTVGVYSKLRRQNLNLPFNKVYRNYQRLKSVPSANNNGDTEAEQQTFRKRHYTEPRNSPKHRLAMFARATILACDCSEGPRSIDRDWTYLVKTFDSHLATAIKGFFNAIVQVLNSAKPDVETVQLNTHVDLSCQCTLVTPSSAVEGEMFVTEDRVLFLSQTATLEDIYRQFLFDLHSGIPVLVTFPLQSVTTVYPRRYLLKENALEVFLTSGKAYFFAFDPESVEIADGLGQRRKAAFNRSNSITLAQEVCERVKSVLLAKCKVGSSKPPTPTDLQVKWLRNQMTNFEYLTLLNRAGGRSHNEMMQYPIFPWVLSDYTSATIDLAAVSSYRDLSKHIPLQKHAPGGSGEDKACVRYHQLESEGSEPYHFPSLYSNSGITAHYLVRIPPFTQACLNYQDGNFDLPDRTFSNFANTWSIADIKELLPEFYMLPEFLSNFCNLNLGVCQNGTRVWDVSLPPWAGNNARRFILVHRQALESAYVRASLPKWVDLIFGCRQQGKAAIDSCNVFHPSTYFQTNSADSQQALLADPVLFAARQAQIRTYGQIPRQLFEFAHPGGGKTAMKKVKQNESLSLLQQNVEESSPGQSDMFIDDNSLAGISVGNYAGSHPKLICVWQADFSFIDITKDTTVDLLISEQSNITILAAPKRPHRRILVSIMAPQKPRRRTTLIPGNLPVGQTSTIANWFAIEVIDSCSGGFTVSTTRRLQTLPVSANSPTEGNRNDTVVSTFYSTPHHHLTSGPVHSSARNLIFFGTSVGLILAYFYRIDEIDTMSNKPEDRVG